MSLFFSSSALNWIYSDLDSLLVILVNALLVLSFSMLNSLSLMVILMPGSLTLIASSISLWLSRLTLTKLNMLSVSVTGTALE